MGDEGKYDRKEEEDEIANELQLDGSRRGDLIDRTMIPKLRRWRVQNMMSSRRPVATIESDTVQWFGSTSSTFALHCHRPEEEAKMDVDIAEASVRSATQ
nr:hypothetical protein CFP56_66861 [Quercus suber]